MYKTNQHCLSYLYCALILSLKKLRYVQEDETDIPWIMSFLNIHEHTERAKECLEYTTEEQPQPLSQRSSKWSCDVDTLLNFLWDIDYDFQPNMTHCYKYCV